MESFLFFFNLINKSSILNFVLVRKGELEGKRVSHRIFLWQTGDCVLRSWFAHYARGRSSVRQLSSEFRGFRKKPLRVKLSAELGGGEVSSLLLLGPCSKEPCRPRAGPARQRPRGRRRSAASRAAPDLPGAAPRAPGLARNPPLSRPQSVVPAAELAEEQKPVCGGRPPATIGLCAALTP